MTVATLSVPRHVEESGLVMPSLPDAASTAAFAIIDVAGRTGTAVEHAIDVVADTTKVVLPAAARTVGAFLPIPEVLNRAVEMGVGLAATVGCTVAAVGAKCALHSVTFGAAAFSSSARRALAVTVATRDILRDTPATDFLARSIATTCERPLLKNDLIIYVNLRSEARLSQEEASVSPERAAELAAGIARLEKRLSGYGEFREICAVFEDSAAFVRDNAKRVDEVALSLADQLLQRTETFYRVRIGSLGGRVVGSWERRESSEERDVARAVARDAIEHRLLKVLRQEVADAQVGGEVVAVRRQLHTVFGTYQALTRGAMSVVGKFAFACVDLNERSKVTDDTTISDRVDDIRDQVLDTCEGIETAVSEEIGLVGGPSPFQSNRKLGVDATGHVTQMENCTSGAPSVPQWGVDDRSVISYDPLRSESAMHNRTLSPEGQRLLSETLAMSPELRAMAREIRDSSEVDGAVPSGR